MSRAAQGLLAYAYAHTKSPAFAEKAVGRSFQPGGGYAKPKLLTGPDVLKPAEEAIEVNTKRGSPDGLTTIQTLELCKDHLPTEVQVRPVRQPRGGAANGD